MLSIYKKEFGENNGNAEMSTNGSPDTLLPSGINLCDNICSLDDGSMKT